MKVLAFALPSVFGVALFGQNWPGVPAKLSQKEKADLIAFLRSLDVTYDIAEPTLP